jgi:hypothetical protein
MKSLKKTLVLLVVLSMILSAVSPVFAFSDAIPEEYAEQANKMEAFGVFTGDTNGNFNATNYITRAEMAKVIGILTGMDQAQADANAGYATKFSDVPAGEWYTGWINLAAGRGIINGFTDGTFRPNDNVTSAQVVTMLVKALGWGVVVENQDGTWPANYIAKADELKLFKNVVATGSELVTRGNVAIYCYNALTARTWTEYESTGNSITSAASTRDTILSKFFSEFTNEKGEMKLVENAKVVATPINNNTIGKQQIVLAEDAETEYESGSDIAAFIDIEKPGRNKETKTYEGANNTIVAYVLESASTELASLQGKYVDVIFGENNEVAYIAVTDEAENGLFVTAWDYAEDEIELNGTKYEVLSDATVSLFGTYVIPTTTSYNATEAIEDILCHSTTLNVDNTTKRFTRNVSASIVLDEEGDIKSIDFVASENFAGLVQVTTLSGSSIYLGMEEAVVEKISNAGKVTTVKNSVINGKKLEDLEEADVRVIKNNAIISVEDINEGDVLTLVITNSSASKTNADIKTIFVSDAVVTGTLDRVKNNVLTIDDEEYNKVNSLNGNTDGDIKEIAPVSDLVDEYLAEEVEVYLNFMGEVSVILSETESIPATLGIVTKIYDEEEDEDLEVEYLPVKILSAETGKATKYNIYNADTEESFVDTTLPTLAVGATVWFSADANGIIEYDEVAEDSDILVVAKADLSGYDTTAEYKVDGKELKVLPLTGITSTTGVDESKYEVTVSGDAYIFDDATTTYYNVCQDDGAEGKIELIKGWASLVKADNDHKLEATDLIFVEDDEVVFYVGNVPTYAGTTEEYAIVEIIDTRRENGKTKTYVTLVDDDTEYEVASIASAVEEGDLVEYSIRNDKITVTEAVDTHTVLTTEDDEALTALGTSVTYKGTLVVDKVDGRRVYYAEYEEEEKETALYLVKTSVTVFDLDEGTVEVVKVEELDEVIRGRYAVGTSADVDSNGNIDTIVIF